MTISRRTILTAPLAFAALPLSRIMAAPLPREVDIVVIGAGAAGIAAARRIAAAGRSVVVIEAAPRIGGRCRTDPALFGVPFDRGAHALYNPDGNPLVKLARGNGFDIAPATASQKIRIGRRNARAGEAEDFLTALVRANRAIDEAARGKADVACAAALPNDLGDWAATVDFVLGPSVTGKELRDLSAMDRARMQERGAAIVCRQGLGALLTRLGGGIPISLGTPATRVAWSNRDVAVDTPAGKIVARAAIVTVSTHVLASGRIAFAPDLPKRQFDAASGLGLGSYDRIALQMDGNPLGLGRDENIIERSKDARTALLVANLGGSSLCTVDVAGKFGADLSAQGEDAMVAFAREWLGGLFGSDAVAKIERSLATRWNADALIGGAMSAATPGAEGGRRLLGEPFGNVFIAGEATHETLYGTVEGAWASGEHAADAALKKIGPAKPPPPQKKPRAKKRHAH
ncbi:MAG: FAD-dependent oxidoreductase [Rhizobiales bacterium]|nr:FAD-dependent oxidoreductase [Hyphomicrobiales bacterium]